MNDNQKERVIMSYTRQVGDMTIFVDCASNPEGNFEKYYKDIADKIIADGYKPKTSMTNLISMIVLSFDCDDNYGEYDEETGCGGYVQNQLFPDERRRG